MSCSAASSCGSDIIVVPRLFRNPSGILMKTQATSRVKPLVCDCTTHNRSSFRASWRSWREPESGKFQREMYAPETTVLLFTQLFGRTPEELTDTRTFAHCLTVFSPCNNG